MTRTVIRMSKIYQDGDPSTVNHRCSSECYDRELELARSQAKTEATAVLHEEVKRLEDSWNARMEQITTRLNFDWEAQRSLILQEKHRELEAMARKHSDQVRVIQDESERVIRAARMESDHSREDAISRLHEDLRNTKRSHQEELTVLLGEAHREIDAKEAAYEAREARRTQEISTLREEINLVTMELDAARSAQRRQEVLARANSTCKNCPVLQDAKDKLQADVQDLERRLQAALNRPDLPCGNCPVLQKANDGLQDSLRGLELRAQEAVLDQQRVTRLLVDTRGSLQDAERRVRETHELLLLEREQHEKELDEHQESMRQLEHDVQEQFMSLGLPGSAPTEQERLQLDADRAALEREKASNQDVLARIEDGLARQETNMGLLSQTEEQLRRDRYSHEARVKHEFAELDRQKALLNVEKREWELRKQADRFRLNSFQAPYKNPTPTPSRKGSPSGKSSATFVTNPLMPAFFSVASTPRYGQEAPLIVQTLQHTEVMTETGESRAPPTYSGGSFEPQPFAPPRTNTAANPDVTGRTAGSVGGLGANSVPYRTAGSSERYPGGHYGGGYQPGQDGQRGADDSRHGRGSGLPGRQGPPSGYPGGDGYGGGGPGDDGPGRRRGGFPGDGRSSNPGYPGGGDPGDGGPPGDPYQPGSFRPPAAGATPAGRQALADARKYAPKLDSVNRPIALEHFLAKFDAILVDYGITERQLVSIFDDRLSQSGVPSVEDWWARRCRDRAQTSWQDARDAFRKEFIHKTESRKMSEITENSRRMKTETVREYAWRIADAARDAGLLADKAVIMMINGCDDIHVSNCLRGAAARPASIEASLEYLQDRDVDLDIRQDGTHAPSRPSGTTSAPGTPSRSARAASRTVAPTHELQEMKATLSQIRKEMSTMAAQQDSRQNDRFSTLHDVVAQIAVAPDQPMLRPGGPSGNTPVVPNISSDPDVETKTDSVVCGRCKILGHPRDVCPRTAYFCTTCRTRGHHPAECGLKQNGGSNAPGRGRPQGGRPKGSNSTCYSCGKLGHFSWGCPLNAKKLGSMPPQAVAALQAWFGDECSGNNVQDASAGTAPEGPTELVLPLLSEERAVGGPDVKDVDSRNTHEDTMTILACRQDASTEDFVLAEGQGLPTRSGRKGFVLAQGQGLPTRSGREEFVLAQGQGLPTRSGRTIAPDEADVGTEDAQLLPVSIRIKDGPRPDTSRTDREPGAQPRLASQPEGMTTHGVAVTLATTQEDLKEEYTNHGVVVPLAATQADKTEEGGMHQDEIDHSSRTEASLAGACRPSAAPPPSDVASDRAVLSPAPASTHPVEVPRTPRSRKAKQDDNFNSKPPVFTPGQVESIMRGDLEGLPDTRMVDIEERLYPVTAEDLNAQLQALKTRHRDVSHGEIAQVVLKALNRPLTADDRMLLEAPANIDDPERWLAWFTRALETCEEARTANRNFEGNRAGIVATTRWARMERKALGSANLPHSGPVPESVCAVLAGPEEATCRLPVAPTEPRHRVKFAGVASFTFLDLDTTARIPIIDLEATRLPASIWRTRRRTLRVRHNYLSLDLDPYQQASAARIRRLRLQRAELRRTSKNTAEESILAKREDANTIDSAPYDLPFASEDLDAFLEAVPGRQDAVLPKPNATMAGVVSSAEAPIIPVCVDGRSTTALVDTGASVTVISQDLWTNIGSPELRRPRTGLVSAENTPMPVLGVWTATVRLADQDVMFPVWVMRTTVTPCILGINILRRFGALVDTTNSLLRFWNTNQTIPFLTDEAGSPHLCATLHLRRDTSPGSDEPPDPCRPGPTDDLSPFVAPLLTTSGLRLKARTRFMVRCRVDATIQDGCPVLIERHPTVDNVHVARSLNVLRDGCVWAQVQNPSDCVLAIPSGTLIGLVSMLPPMYASELDVTLASPSGQSGSPSTGTSTSQFIPQPIPEERRKVCSISRGVVGAVTRSIGKQSRTKTGRPEVPKEQEQPGQEDGEPSRKTPRTRAETPEQTIENQEGARAQPEPLTNLPPYKDDTYVLPDRVLRAEQPKDPFVLAMKAYLECKALPLDAWLMRLDGDVAFTNSSSPVSRVLDKRQGVASEKDYLVEYADGSQQWVGRSRLADYGSFITDYENRVRERAGLPTLRRSPRLSALDEEAVVREF
ncbi:hypothetical protein B5M09_009610 [Aphanomyces astaci]|uniref:CCHC-type domain-containing protein n=1 Tax=Aphanomyces astaci TaxID=112090 RepID=A0A3R7XSA6_APHAT|nr:hypothetical protein B5M09_009610 [Aphanomyces astaci]